MSKKGKKYVEAAKQIEAGKLYSIEEAIELVKKTTTAKFDASVDVVFKLNLDTRHADQQLRGAIVLPNGTGKTKRVCVIAEGPKAEEAKKYGYVPGNPKVKDVNQNGKYDQEDQFI